MNDAAVGKPNVPQDFVVQSRPVFYATKKQLYMYKIKVASLDSCPRILAITRFKPRVKGNTIVILANTSTHMGWLRETTVLWRLDGSEIPADHLPRRTWVEILTTISNS